MSTIGLRAPGAPRPRRGGRAALLALVAAVALLLSACGAGGRPSGEEGGAQPGITPQSVKVGSPG